MVLSRFIDELKHNSTNIIIILESDEDDRDVYYGTKGEIVHNVNYIKKWSKLEITQINAGDDSLPYPTFEICLWDRDIC